MRHSIDIRILNEIHTVLKVAEMQNQHMVPVALPQGGNQDHCHKPLKGKIRHFMIFVNCNRPGA